ncbi:DNA mismatch endonuclease Vsr [Pseudomonas sp. A4002]|jgi:DNA mismatch endonuclease (patch repair protein)|nr:MULTISPECIES: DNA mismatch endonuclease Vsr [unclassified Pseudomonas]NVZ36143.1 DNA mismatch endonuclease Vsr [Pseudomonas sp. A4002]NWB77457.1 DNA mismatch endonuclease Vsr [Pseudomonas sp. F9001]
MIDIVDGVTRSRMMAGILGRNTKPELIVRRYLHACGYRYRLHRKDLPGKPDLVFSKYKLVIFVHGCFWHRHANCVYATSPGSRRDFWEEKLNGNVSRDQKQISLLNAKGWRVVVVWECGLKHLLNELSFLNEMILNLDEALQEWPESPPKSAR